MMVYGQIVEGSPRELAEKIAAIVGDHRIRVMLMNEVGAGAKNPPRTEQEIQAALAEFDAMAVRVGHVDDSREAIYTRMEGE
jgi:hypothetical protein